MVPRPAATLVDVARAAGVSRTTASAALGANGRVSAATRERVRSAASALGYVANPTARRLRGRLRGAIGLYLPPGGAQQLFYLDYMNGAAQAARAEDVVLTLLLPGEELGTLRMAAHVDGVLIVDPELDDPTIARIFATGLPVVSSEASLDPALQPRVTLESDYVTSFRRLLDHLRARGAVRPALLNVDQDFSWRHIVDGAFAAWCGEHGFEPLLRRVPPAGEPDEVRPIARALLADAAPDAIVGAYGNMPLGVLGAVSDAGRRPGADVLVAGGIDSLLLRHARPAVTAMDSRAVEIGRDAATAMLRLLREEDVPPHIARGAMELNVRESTAGRGAEAITG